MILDFPRGDWIYADQKPVARNVRINFASNRQMRIKAELAKDDDCIPIDLIVYNYDYNLTKLTQLEFVASGEERIHHKPFRVRVTYDILKQELHLRGDVNGTAINSQITSPADILINVTKALKG